MTIKNLFLSVGAMKAGTTWLHQQFAGHPDIHFCPEKEIHYFADPKGETYMSLEGRLGRYQQVVRNIKHERLNAHVQRNLAWYAQSYLAPSVNDSWYEALFDMRPPTKEGAAYVADFSNLYATLNEEGWAHIYQIAETVRAVFTMRHPAKRLWSHLKFSYEFSGRAHELEHITETQIRTFMQSQNTIDHADYAGSVARLRSFLGEKSIRFYFFENFRDNPLDSLRDIESYLSIRGHSYAEERLRKQVNPSKDRAVPRLFAQLANEVTAVQSEKLAALGLTVPASWSEDI